MQLVKIGAIVLFFGYSTCHLEEYYRWKQIRFQHIDSDNDGNIFPRSVKEYENSNANVIPYNNVPMGITHFKGKIIVTIPRRKPGVASTLNYFSTKLPKDSNPSLIPFPDVKTNELHPQLIPDCHKIISVYRTRVDDCDRLWFVDTGALQYNKTIQVQRPSLWIIDMTTEQIIKRFEIPEYLVKPGHGLISLKVDVEKNSCSDAYAYIPDLLTHQIHVYSYQQNQMWSFKHNYLEFEPNKGHFNVAGFQYTWPDGVFSVTLGKRNSDGYRTAYFHPMASISEYAVSTEVLQNEEASRRLDHGNDFKKLGERGDNSTQSAMHDFDQHSGIMIFTQISKNGLSCWNSAMPFTPANNALIVRDDLVMIYPADLNIDNNGTVWVLTNTLPRFVYGNLDTNDYNFRIWKGNVQDIVRGTVCDYTEERKRKKCRHH